MAYLPPQITSLVSSLCHPSCFFHVTWWFLLAGRLWSWQTTVDFWHFVRKASIAFCEITGLPYYGFIFYILLDMEYILLCFCSVIWFLCAKCSFETKLHHNLHKLYSVFCWLADTVIWQYCTTQFKTIKQSWPFSLCNRFHHLMIDSNSYNVKQISTDNPCIHWQKTDYWQSCLSLVWSSQWHTVPISLNHCHKPGILNHTQLKYQNLETQTLKQEGSISTQRVIEHNFIETVSTNNISVQRGGGAGDDRGVKNKTKTNKKKNIQWIYEKLKDQEEKVADSTGQKKILLMESDRQWQGIFCIYFVQKIN